MAIIKARIFCWASSMVSKPSRTMRPGARLTPGGRFSNSCLVTRGGGFDQHLRRTRFRPRLLQDGDETGAALLFRLRPLAGHQSTQRRNDRFFGDQHGGADRALIRDRLQDDLRTPAFDAELVRRAGRCRSQGREGKSALRRSLPNAPPNWAGVSAGAACVAWLAPVNSLHCSDWREMPRKLPPMLRLEPASSRAAVIRRSGDAGPSPKPPRTCGRGRKPAPRLVRAALQSWGALGERVSPIFAVRAGQCCGGGPVPGRAFGKAWDFLPVSQPDWRGAGLLPFESVRKRAKPGPSAAARSTSFASWSNRTSMAWGRGVVRRSKPTARARRYNETQGFSSSRRGGFMQVMQ